MKEIDETPLLKIEKLKNFIRDLEYIYFSIWRGYDIGGNEEIWVLNHRLLADGKITITVKDSQYVSHVGEGLCGIECDIDFNAMVENLKLYLKSQMPNLFN